MSGETAALRLPKAKGPIMTSSLPEPVARLIAAANAGDAEACIETFAVDATVNDRGRVVTGRDAIRAWADGHLRGAAVTVDVTAEITTREHATVTATVGRGGASARVYLSFTVADGLISDMTITI
ncbi:polyketide cyclase [Mycetocola zhujimingii]|uniref:Polyketide cyclase n=2 Tax=Mycetocola zhujimingii TaxID=2079792 RepID=A0A2U1TAY3_9MICO|nr:polyketide cyclase [Mycetocola zhujimingii]